MNKIEKLEMQRERVMRELASIRSARKGSLNEQWFPIVRNGKKTEQLRGPYFVWTCKVGKKTVSERLTDEQAVTRAKQDTENYRRLKSLWAEFEELTIQLGEAERTREVDLEELNKGLTSRSSTAR